MRYNLGLAWTSTEFRESTGASRSETIPVDGDPATSVTFLGPEAAEWWLGVFSLAPGATVDMVTVRWWSQRNAIGNVIVLDSVGDSVGYVTLPSWAGWNQVTEIPLSSSVTGGGSVRVTQPAGVNPAGLYEVTLSGGPRGARRLWARGGQWFDSSGRPTTVAPGEAVYPGSPPEVEWDGDELDGWTAP